MEDQKVIALLNERFSEVNARFDAVDARFDAVDGRFDAVDGRLDRVEGEIGGLRVEVRHAGVEIEELRGAVQQNNELLHAVDEKLERFREETTENFKDVRSDIHMSCTVLGKRITDLETRHS